MIINGSAYGLASTYNAIRRAASMAKRDEVEMTVFLMGDGVTAAVKGQMTCMDARGITGHMLLDSARRSTMEELADHTLGADKVLVF
jgi:uncharacterized protein involved in oxidation of intracellular sulfur